MAAAVETRPPVAVVSPQHPGPNASTSTVPQQTTAIDAAWFPHLIDSIIDYSCDAEAPVQLSLRSISRSWRDRIDASVARRLVLSPSASGGGVDISVIPEFSGFESGRPIFCAKAKTHEHQHQHHHYAAPDAAEARRLLSLGKVIDIAGPVDCTALASMIPAPTPIDTLRMRTNALGAIPLAPFVPSTLVVWHDPSIPAAEADMFAPRPTPPTCTRARIAKEAVNVPLGNVLETLAFCSLRLRNTEAAELVFHFGRWGRRYLQGDALSALQWGLSSAASRNKNVCVTVVGLDVERRSNSPVPDVFAGNKHHPAREPTDMGDVADMQHVAAAAGPAGLTFLSLNAYAELVGERAFRLETFI